MKVDDSEGKNLEPKGAGWLREFLTFQFELRAIPKYLLIVLILSENTKEIWLVKQPLPLCS